jgi:hypothetical protein
LSPTSGCRRLCVESGTAEVFPVWSASPVDTAVHKLFGVRLRTNVFILGRFEEQSEKLSETCGMRVDCQSVGSVQSVGAGIADGLFCDRDVPIPGLCQLSEDVAGFLQSRHTFASLMIAAGVNAKALSTYLGHSAVAITFDR